MRAAFLLLIVLIFAFLLAPLVVVVIVSFDASTSVAFPPTSFSLRWYWETMQSDLFRQSLVNSVLIGVCAASGSTVLGLGAALVLVRNQFPGKAAVEALFLSPLIVPGIVLGIALLVAFARAGFGDAWTRLLLAHLLITFPYCVRTTAASLARIDPTYEQAAATLGASQLVTFLKVVLPMIRPGLIAGFLFSFVISLDNVPVSIFLVDAETTTIPVAIMSYLEYNFDPSVAAVSSILIFLVLTLAIVLERVTGLRRMFGG